MKDELIEYAKHTLLYRKAQKNNCSLFFSDFIFGLCATIMLIACSLPFLIKNTYLWICLLVLWIWMLICRKKEKDKYSKAILIDGMFLLYFSIFSSSILIDFQIEGKSDLRVLPLLLISTFFLLTYELVILIRIKQKKYSCRKQSVFSKKRKKINNRLIFLLSFLGAFGGVTLSKLTSNLISSSIYQMIFVIGISLLWLCGCILLQKYIILKILKYKTGENSPT